MNRTTACSFIEQWASLLQAKHNHVNTRIAQTHTYSTTTDLITHTHTHHQHTHTNTHTHTHTHVHFPIHIHTVIGINLFSLRRQESRFFIVCVLWMLFSLYSQAVCVCVCVCVCVSCSSNILACGTRF